jgi:hypothetical protein
VLDLDECRYPLRVRANLGYELAAVNEVEPYDCREVPGFEDLLHWPAAEMLHAPLNKVPWIDGLRAR